jgi:hypothetical protein
MAQMCMIKNDFKGNLIIIFTTAFTITTLHFVRYSIQRSIRFRKYYKSIAMGLFDIGLVNAYILHCESMKKQNSKPLTHATFRRYLSAQLYHVKDSDLVDDDVTDGMTAVLLSFLLTFLSDRLLVPTSS